MISKKQKIHLEAPKGLMNDPNGLCWYKGELYVFFQWNRFSKDHSYKEWGLFKSSNLLDWDFHGSAIVPDQEYDNNGVYSGNALEIDGKMHIYYTGNTKPNGIRKTYQCLAETDDGELFQKKGIILNTPKDFTEHFRDPFVWKGKDQKYYMVVGAQKVSGKGAIALYKSCDGKKWNYIGILAESDNCEMIECPVVFSLGEQQILLFCSQHRDNDKDEVLWSESLYQLGEWEPQTGDFTVGNLDEKYSRLDWGMDFYAPQTVCMPDGRTILFAWMSQMDGEQTEIFGEGEPNVHCMTLPRELTLRENRICQRPARELYQLLDDHIQIPKEKNHFQQETIAEMVSLSERTWYCKMELLQQEGIFELNINQSEVVFCYDPGEKQLVFQRKSWIRDGLEQKEVILEKLDDLEIWFDTSSIEIFINGGSVVLSARVIPTQQHTKIRFQKSSKDMIKSMNMYKMKGRKSN